MTTEMGLAESLYPDMGPPYVPQETSCSLAAASGTRTSTGRLSGKS